MLNVLKNLFAPATDYANMIKNGAVIIDVRSRIEYRGGHIQQSKNIPLEEVSQNIGLLKELRAPVITVCRSGNRSAMAVSILSKAGIEAYNGGAWSALQKTSK
jgi:rhodanese-related sulfurtransferase